MLVVGVTGGIGSGKSTFARLLADRGAYLIDADAISREEMQPGQSGWKAAVDQFGDEILSAASLDIDRKRLAAIVFSDKEKLAALNAIMHPRIFRHIADELDALRPTDTIVVLDAPLLVETGLVDIADVVVVITAPRPMRIGRLSDRGLSLVDATARIAAQAPEEELVTRADFVVTNDRDLALLEKRVDEIWQDILAWPKKR